MLLWTAAVSFAIVGCDKETLPLVWNYLYWPWVVILGIWAVTAAGLWIASFFQPPKPDTGLPPLKAQVDTDAAS